jgi:hypothetical protein
VSIETIRQNFVPESQVSSSHAVVNQQGLYRGETVTATNESSIVTAVAMQGSNIVTLPRANRLSLVQSIQKESTISTTALYQILAVTHELDKTALPQIFQFLARLAALAHDEEDETLEDPEEGELWGSRGREIYDDPGDHGDDSSSDGGSYSEDNFEEGIYRSLGKLSNTADKAAAISIARGYFEAKDAHPRLLNALNAVSGKFYRIDEGAQLAQLAAAEEAKLASATLETSPAIVRLRYRKKLREKSNLGELFEELVSLGLESTFLSLFVEIGADLAGIGQQSDRGYLRWLTVELKRLWQLRSVYDETNELLRITEPHLSKSDTKPELTKVTGSLLYYCAKLTVGPQDAQLLLGSLERCSLESQLVFANALRDLHSRMPDGIWPAITERLLQYNALGELCYRLTEAEERFYEQSKA